MVVVLIIDIILTVITVRKFYLTMRNMLFNETSLEREPFANIPYVFKEHPMQT